MTEAADAGVVLLQLPQLQYQSNVRHGRPLMPLALEEVAKHAPVPVPVHTRRHSSFAVPAEEEDPADCFASVVPPAM